VLHLRDARALCGQLHAPPIIGTDRKISEAAWPEQAAMI
jgi:hypothetical protein